MSQLFASGGRSIGAPASASIFTLNIQDWFPLKTDWFDLLAVEGTLKSVFQNQNLKVAIFRHSAFFTLFNEFIFLYLF